MPLSKPVIVKTLLHIGVAALLAYVAFALLREQFPLSYRDAISRASESVVSIYARGRDGAEKSIGSGVIIRSDEGVGHIITNYHLLNNTHAIEVELHDGTSHTAALIGIDPAIDLAILRVQAQNLHPIAQQNGRTPQAGDIVFAIGSPYGLNRSASMGIISAIGRDRLGLYESEYFIQTDAAINPGSSGGPLVNARAELVGINSAMFYKRHGTGPQGIGFAIPSDVVWESYNQLVLRAPDESNTWGMELRHVSESLLDIYERETPASAFMVARVWEHSPISQTDIQVGDLLLSINDEAPDSFIQSGVLSPQTRSVVVRRNGEEYQYTLPTIYSATQ